MNPSVLIVNADDVGLCDEVDDGVLDAIRAGTVTSVSALVNPPFGAEIARFQDQGVSVGLHLNLVVGSPCAPPRWVPGLLGRGGSFRGFRGGAAFQDPSAVPAFEPTEVEMELRAQLDAFVEAAGRAPSHLDVHKHLHRDHDTVMEQGLQLARALGVPIRCLNDAMRARCAGAGVAHAGNFLGGVDPAPYWTIERLRQSVAALPPGVTELMCHPGRPMPSIAGISYTAGRDGERSMFVSEEAWRLLSGFHLANFLTAPFVGKGGAAASGGKARG